MSRNNLPALKKMAENPAFQSRIAKLMNSDTYVESLLSLVGGNPKLQQCTPESVMKSSLIAASLQLPVNPVLQYAYLVPFKDTATFQVGFRGLIQLALRTKHYKTIHACEIYKDEYLGYSPLTGEVKIKAETGTEGDRSTGGEVYGYFAVIETHDGFKSQKFMTKAQTEAHALKYSQAYKYDKSSGKKLSPWSTAFDQMSTKTVLKSVLSKYGQLTPELQTALEAEAEIPTVQDAESGQTVSAPEPAQEIKAEVVVEQSQEQAPPHDDEQMPDAFNI